MKISISARVITSHGKRDNKVCFLRMEGKLFGDIPMNLELRLSVEDSPNSAGVAIDSIRCAKLAARTRARWRVNRAFRLFLQTPARAVQR